MDRWKKAAVLKTARDPSSRNRIIIIIIIIY